MVKLVNGKYYVYNYFVVQSTKAGDENRYALSNI